MEKQKILIGSGSEGELFRYIRCKAGIPQVVLCYYTGVSMLALAPFEYNIIGASISEGHKRKLEQGLEDLINNPELTLQIRRKIKGKLI